MSREHEEFLERVVRRAVAEGNASGDGPGGDPAKDRAQKLRLFAEKVKRVHQREEAKRERAALDDAEVPNADAEQRPPDGPEPSKAAGEPVASGEPVAADLAELERSRPGAAEPIAHSPRVDELLTEVPSWLVRSGIGLIALAALAFLSIAWFVRYPEVIAGTVVVTTTQPVLPVIAESSGELVLLSRDGQPIEAGDTLGYLRRAESYDDVMRVSQLVRRLRTGLDGGRLQESLPAANDLDLGSLENGFTRLVDAYESYGAFRRDDILSASIGALEEQRRVLEAQTATFEDQLRLGARALEIAHEKHGRMEGLLREGAISPVDLRESERTLLSAEQALASLRGNLHSQKIHGSQVRRQLAELRHQRRETERELSSALGAALEDLSAQIASWDDRNVLRAPRDGRVSLFTFWHDGEFVQTGEEVMVILPDGDPGALVGKISLARDGAGRVRPGQRARIRLALYPHQDFGAVPAVVRSITPVAREDRYVAHVDFPKRLRTSYGHEVELRQEMTGDAEIFTDDLRLLERIFHQFRALLERA